MFDQQVNVVRRVDRADHDIGTGRQLGDAGRVADPLPEWLKGGFGGVRRHPSGRSGHLRQADVIGGVDELPGEILDLDNVGIDQDDSTDAQAHQRLQNSRTESPLSAAASCTAASDDRGESQATAARPSAAEVVIEIL